MNTKQMEFGLDGNRSQCRTPARRRTSPGARWWFDQMHSVVDRAFDWSRTAQARYDWTSVGRKLTNELETLAEASPTASSHRPGVALL